MTRSSKPILPKGISEGARRSLLVVVLLVTLTAGLDPKGYRFRNEVSRLTDTPGLRFGRFGRVHTEPFLTAEQAAKLNRDGFTVEIALDLTNDSSGAFRFLASLHAGDDRSQLVVGQWRQHIIVMNGNDYAYRRRLPRISTDTSDQPTGPTLLTITTGVRGTRLYLNGREASMKEDLRLTLPAEPDQGRLVLGNSVHANNPWNGILLGFAAYSDSITTDQAANRYAQWRAAGDFSFAKAAEPLLLYTFDEAHGSPVSNQGSLTADLAIPPRLFAFGRRALAPPSLHVEFDRSMAVDMIVNFIGLIPFGIALALASATVVRSNWKMVLHATAVGFLLSLLMESVQAWIPSRDSSLLDLLLNTVGTLIGAMIFALLPKRLADSRPHQLDRAME